MDLPEDWDDETVQDALDVLQDVVAWEMTTQRWEQVAEILHRVEKALVDQDAGALRAAVADLEQSTPVRILRVGAKTVTGIPQPLLERRNALVHWFTPGDDGDHRQPR